MCFGEYFYIEIPFSFHWIIKKDMYLEGSYT